jgi:hypothetical protein
MSIRSRIAGVGVAFVLLTAPGFAGQFSFTGVFANDNDVQLFTFGLLAPTTVTLQTWSYGGGTDANGQTIAAGGFEPLLEVFDALSLAPASGLLLPGTFSSCPPNRADTNRIPACYDVLAQLSLTAGNYFLALTQNPNAAVGNLGDGFQFDGDPTFNSGFAGSFGAQGDGHWEVDILAADNAAAVTATPEPGSLWLSAAAMLLAGIGFRKVRPRAGSCS